MTNSAKPIRIPDLNDRPFGLSVEHAFPNSVRMLYEAWTEKFDVWFAASGSVLMQPEINVPFFFETEYKFEAKEKAQRHAHYGRFLRLLPDQLIQMTWVTGKGGTEGAETIVTVGIKTRSSGCLLSLKHEGFPNAELRDKHQNAWPEVLNRLEEKLGSISQC